MSMLDKKAGSGSGRRPVAVAPLSMNELESYIFFAFREYAQAEPDWERAVCGALRALLEFAKSREQLLEEQQPFTVCRVGIERFRASRAGNDKQDESGLGMTNRTNPDFHILL
ncbi:unnamed protein product [Amoebophrya sp. A120]|nr:unnamed protein product [Amoebophrya sp. A120]|eukprot:GSA120T00020517001.1